MAPRTLKWGILATGGIAQTFTKDLLLDPTTRGVDSIKHTVVAASSSSSADRAKSFLKDMGAPSDAKAYGSYEELAKDPNVEIIYVATPHSHHYQNVRLCLENNKHVLCEKAFTVNAPQLKKLVEIAREKKLFLMEVSVRRSHSKSRANTSFSGCLDSLFPSFHLRPGADHFRPHWQASPRPCR
jgi:dihydrodiol dehydrogenase / D-xylose 1-dehydrogenase (NADP)